MRRYYTFFILLLCPFFTFADEVQKKEYALTDDPIDVVIVTHPKDKETLNRCIEGIRKNCKAVRRVIVVSSEPLSRKAEWFDEAKFPFSKHDVFMMIGRGDEQTAKRFFHYEGRRQEGWYYQQLLKLYSPFVIPDISSNVLVLDSDTIFLNPVEFLNESNGGLFCVNEERAKRSYIKRYIYHAQRLVPGYQRMHPEVYSVCHHMLFQKAILQELFDVVEKHHQRPLWEAFCLCVDLKYSGASEYEIYYSYALLHSSQVELRPLKWADSPDLKEIKNFKRKGYHFVSFHRYLRG